MEKNNPDLSLKNLNLPIKVENIIIGEETLSKKIETFNTTTTCHKKINV